MPPKKRGHNARGREKIFRNAVQHVHVGIGYNVLGAINMQPAGGFTDDWAPHPESEDCAFLTELNEQMLSHSTTDFKSFRWEVLDLCSSRALFQLNHRKIAQKLLLAMMNRDKFAEGFEAFARLTVAFARDMREKFFLYFECFHQAINGGIYDANGQLLAETRRLQLIFSAQAAWCREMRPFWLLQEQRKLVELVIKLYVRQMHDSKEYIRRLAAEVLASTCRMTRELLPLVLEVMCVDVVHDFKDYCGDDARKVRGADDDVDGMDNEEEYEESHGTIGTHHEEGNRVREVMGSKTNALTLDRLLRYQKERLSFLPVVDSLCFFAADVLRGIRGSLNTNFENFYVVLIYVFGLSNRTNFSSAYDSGYGVNEQEFFGFTVEEAEGFAHYTHWKELFLESREEYEKEGVEFVQQHGDTQTGVLGELVQMIGATSIGSALRTLLEETTNSSATTASMADVDDDFEEDRDDSGSVHSPPLQMLTTVVATLDFTAPFLHLLQQLLHAKDCLLLWKGASLPAIRQMAKQLQFFLANRREALAHNDVAICGHPTAGWCHLVRSCGAALELFTPLCVDTGMVPRSHMAKLHDLCLPLCRDIISTCVSVSSFKGDGSIGPQGVTLDLELQTSTRLLLFAFVQDVLQKNYAYSLRQERIIHERDDEESANQMGTVGRSRSGSDRVKSRLTSFAYALLAPVLHASCKMANASLSKLNSGDTLEDRDEASHSSGPDEESIAFRDTTHAVMMIGMMCDRTRNTSVSPLHLLTTTTLTTAFGEGSKKRNNNNNNNNLSLEEHVTLMKDIQTLLLGTAALFTSLQSAAEAFTARTKAAKWADVLIAVLPPALVVAEAERTTLRQTRGNEPAEANALFAWQFRDALLQVISAVKLAVHGAPSATSARVTASSFALFAQVSALLMQLAPLCGAPESDKDSMEFIRDAVVILATSFEEHRVVILGDSEVGRLLHGMECLLHAMFRLFGVEESLVADGEGSEATVAVHKKEKAKGHVVSQQISQQRQTFLSATARLHETLDDKSQRALVHTLLFEALVSPIQSLRVVALRLLRLFCHPEVEDTKRVSGCSSVDPTFFDSLLRAELFNPLSSAGNLDGIQQALAKLSFDAASGALREPLRRVILARAMMGLLHTKYSVAWPIALKILSDLVKSEDTVARRHGTGLHQLRDDGSPFGDNEEVEDCKSLLDPLVWETVISRYARSIVLGDIVRVASSASNECDTDDCYNNNSTSNYKGTESSIHSSSSPLFYRIQLTDMQRHEKGELVSKDFSTAQYKSSTVTWLLLVNNDGEILMWERHYLPAVSPTYTHGRAAARHATDRAVLAKTFLSGLSDMARTGGGSAADTKDSLVAELAVELSAIRCGEHPSGIRHLKMLDERLTLALNAYTAAATVAYTEEESPLQPSGQSREDATLLTKRLHRICASLVSDSNTKLQRAAIDLLRRLKVAPFSRYYRQLVPFCDTQQNLFNFLSSFHVETDVPQEHRADYIATALTVALPKLTSSVSRDKVKDQAVLQRRLLAFVTHLTDRGEFTAVLNGLVQRLIVEHVTPTKAAGSGVFCFGSWWEKWVREQTHCTRRLERLLRQLLNTTKLLSALLQAVGKGFSSFAGTCLLLGINAYLISCKQTLLAPLSATTFPGINGGACDDGATQEEIGWRVKSALSSSALKSLMSRMRRGAATMVASLFEQFPAEVMETLRADLGVGSGDTGAASVEHSLISRYVAALHMNGGGAVAELIGDSQRAAATPFMRLVRAWIASPHTLPLVGTFAGAVTEMIKQLFAANSTVTGTTNTSGSGLSVLSRNNQQQTAVLALHEGLRCVAELLNASDEQINVFGATEQSTLRVMFVEPHVSEIFTSLYTLIRRGASCGVREKNTRFPASRDKGGRPATTVMSFSVSMWKELITTVSMLTEYVVVIEKQNAEEKESAGGKHANSEDTNTMLSRLLEMCIAFVAHPACMKDRETCVAAVGVLEYLLPHVHRINVLLHYEPLVHLFNAVTNPEARLLLCRTLNVMLTQMGAVSSSSDPVSCFCNEENTDFLLDGVQRGSRGYAAQLAAVGRAVSCLNSFDDNNSSLDRYDFDLRFHTLRTLQQFFHNGGESAPVSIGKRKRAQQSQVREERDYSGDFDSTIPLDDLEAPVLCVEGFLVLASNAVFFLRDPEGTISALAVQVVEAMIRYASRQNTRVAEYDTLILNQVIRRIILPSLRRGVVARDVHIRNSHMQVFGALAQHYKDSFRSFAALYDRNVELNFFVNIGHLQHRCRLNALALLRKKVDQLHPRDALRVFVPFLLATVKDFAQGKRDLQNLTEGRAKGYCDALLNTVATVAGMLPWEGYYRLLSLLLINAQENASLRLPMLQGVVLVLDHFHFLEEGVDDKIGTCSNNNNDIPEDGRQRKGAEESPQTAQGDDYDEDEDGENDDDAVAAALEVTLRAKRIKYRNARIMHVMEDDILPQLYGFLSSGTRRSGIHASGSEVLVSAHTATSVRDEMRKTDGAQQNTTILQLPVAIAITKIVKRFPLDRFSSHAEQLLDEVVLKLRTKNDKHRERARRVLSAMMCEVGPGKLGFIITKLRDHLVHGYQLHVLGYTVVTLLYNLYEPRHSLSYGRKKTPGKKLHKEAGAKARHSVVGGGEAIRPNGSQQHDKQGGGALGQTSNSKEKSGDDVTTGNHEDDEEEELLRMIIPAAVQFDYEYGVSCLTACLDDIMTILLDDYLGEVSEQKRQVELMSTMLEVKSSRALHGFTLIASHCQATRVIEVFLQKITWLLTPPSEAANVETNTRGGGARAGALLLLQELKTKYSTIGKSAAADFAFVQKVRLLAVRVARALLKNATMEVESSFRVVRDLLHRHNETREEKIKKFEAKEGTRRIRGSAQLIAQRPSVIATTRREQLDANFLVAPRPERVDVDFSAHTVLATQQKQKLRTYRGRYGKDVKQAAKHFYREDPTAAVVLDTLDEFLLKYLLSVLKQVLGMGKERKSSKIAVRLDLLRSKNKQKEEQTDGDNYITHTNASDEEGEQDASSVSSADVLLDPENLDDREGDALDRFAAEAEERDDEQRQKETGEPSKKLCVRTEKRKRRGSADLTASFTRHYQQLLEELVPVVLSTLHGEGSDAVIGYALDCMLTLLSLRPPLKIVGMYHTNLYDTVTAFFERGGSVKQRAMRVAASVISHQRFTLTEAQASQITGLCHAELVERNRFAPMALTLFYAVLGRHVHVVEVYELMGVVTELLLHVSAKRLMRQRCISVITRFLTEYRMTPEKFRSHMDLLYRNMDYPEVTGRIALLELFIALINRLPTVVLRQEAPLLLLPLAVTLSGSEFLEARRKAGTALQDLVRNAGVDTVVPTLSKWLEKDQTRKRKTIALQTWALMLSAIASALGLSGKDNDSSSDNTKGITAEAEEFATYYTWSLPSIMDAATYDQISASRIRRRSEELSGTLRRKIEMKGWMYVFFGLRCVEAIASAAPSLVWHDVTFAKPLVLYLSGRLILHTHPWVRGVALRLLGMYCTNGVETRCSYLVDDGWVGAHLVTSAVEVLGSKRRRSEKDTSQKPTRRSRNSAVAIQPSSTASGDTLPYMVVFRGTGPIDNTDRAEEVLNEISASLRLLLLNFAQSDVSNEKYAAHRAIARSSRTDAVRLALYLIRSLAAVSMALLVNATANESEEGLLHVREVVTRHFVALRRQFNSIAAPAISNGSVTNVMVRTASLVQCFGGLVAAMPCVNGNGRKTSRGDNKSASETLGDVNEGERVDVGSVARWLLCNAINLEFIQQTVAPTVAVAMRCGRRSEKLSTLATQVAYVLREQLEARRHDYDTARAHADDENAAVNVSPLEGRKKLRKISRDKSNNGNCDRCTGSFVTVDDALFALTTVAEEIKNARKDELARRDTTNTLRKRARSADESYPKGNKRARTSRR
ncbi:uncharacterized protein TEOVI_000258200 [Trypanosoma equiperdum]|uniref:Uncharacterized protein n=1 Tax=Trypanosoma equiperdum TaxID=5694 RepID=A0A1G4IFB2_TRYEQ|nr:hypothetical protein, conserved [Trypanosoma equiperdum]